MIWACYKDDDFICLGTLKEIALYLGVSYDTVKTYKSKKIHYIFVKCQVIKGTFKYLERNSLLYLNYRTFCYRLRKEMRRQLTVLITLLILANVFIILCMLKIAHDIDELEDYENKNEEKESEE